MKLKHILLTTLFSSVLFSQVKTDSIQNIDQVNIIIKKKLLERKADRLIFNVEASITSQGMDGVETLANVPMIKIDHNLGSISITGKNSVNVMINGKMLNLSGVTLLNYLKTIRSENISKIEVITTPPAKYEAQGNSGLINIILKKKSFLGWSGSVNTGLNQRTFFSGNINGAINYQNEKLSLSFKIGSLDGAKRSIENYTILGASQNYSQSVRKDLWNGLTSNLNLSYKLNNNSEIGMEYIYSQKNQGMFIINETKNISSDSTVENLLTNTHHREKNPTHTLSVYYDLKLDSLGKTMSFTGNFFKNISNTDVSFSTLKQSDNSIQNVKTSSFLTPQVFTLQGDLELPFSFGTIETGLKFNQFKNSTDLQYFNIINSQYIPDLQRANSFEYQEENYAAYVGYAKKIGRLWEIKVGLRYENTNVKSFTPLTNIGNKYNYGQWFPSAFVSYKEKKNIFSLSYSRRINRPTMDNLNPFRWYENTYSFSSGNPLLKPSYINNLELGYTYNGKFSANIYYLKSKNGFGQVSFLYGVSQIGTYLNYYDNTIYGFTSSYTNKYLKFWEVSLSVNGSLIDSKVYDIEANLQKGYSVSYILNNTFTLNKNKTLFFFMNYSQDLPSKNVNYSSPNASYLDSGIKISLMEKLIQINAIVTNIFAQKYRGNIYFSDNSQHFSNYWDGRGFRLSINYTLGNNKKKVSTKSIDFKEKDRTN